MRSSKNSLEEYLHTHIPLSQAMGVSVKSITEKQIVLGAQYKPNINHKNTVFGGSSHALAILSCWSLVYVHLLEMPDQYEIVIAQGDSTYLKPVSDEFEAICALPEETKWERFLLILDKKKKARIQLTATIGDPLNPAVKFEGSFAAFLI